MKIDLHLHCSERSACSISTEQEQIETAIKNGLDGLAITDHDKLIPKKQLDYLNKKYAPFKIFTGIEVRTIDKGEDFLVYGIHDKTLESRNWLYKDLYFFVKQRNGYLAYAHPYRYANYSVANVHEYKPDAVEIHSSNIGRDDEKMLRNLAKELNANVIANSDSHYMDSIGIYYNDFYDQINNDEELVNALKLGKYTIGCNKDFLAKYNKPIRQREQLISDYISQGKSSSVYAKETGNPEQWYDRVLNKRTMEI